MKKTGSLLLLSLVIMFGLFGCSQFDGTEESGSGTETTTEAEASDSNESEDIVKETDEDVTLPDGIPEDFPLPENITLTEVEEEKNEGKYTYDIRFTFDPNMDMDATFDMYNAYAKSLDYTIIVGGEEYFADGIFQFAATSTQSGSNMFVVTLQAEGETYGHIELSLTE